MPNLEAITAEANASAAAESQNQEAKTASPEQQEFDRTLAGEGQLEIPEKFVGKSPMEKS